MNGPSWQFAIASASGCPPPEYEPPMSETDEENQEVYDCYELPMVMNEPKEESPA